VAVYKRKRHIGFFFCWFDKLSHKYTQKINNFSFPCPIAGR
jgi:hypothetical protein